MNMQTLFPEAYNFKEQIAPKKRISELRILRTLGFLMHIYAYYLNYKVLDDKSLLFIYFTTWGIVMTLFTFAFLFIAIYTTNENYHKFCFIAFEATWTAQSVITIFFWLVLSWFFPEGFATLYMIYVNLMIHACPFLMLSIDLFITKMLFSLSHIVFVMIPPIFYMFVSIYLSLGYDIVAYPVLTWKDYSTIISVVFLVILFVGSFFVGHYIGKRTFKKNEEASSLIRSE